MSKLRIVFMGTPLFSVNILKGLTRNYDVVGVVTQPDKEVGRKKEIKFSPVKEVALAHNIEVIQPLKIRIEFADVLALKPDLIVTCAYGQIIPKEILDYPKYGCINVHASLLPKLRGGAPIHKAIINGYAKTGITIMEMVEKMDAGDILTYVETKIEEDDNVGTLHDRLSLLGTKLLLETIPKIINGTITKTKQNEDEVTYAWNIKREEELIDFNKTKQEIFNQIRGLNPFPSGYAILEEKEIKIYNSRIGEHFCNNYMGDDPCNNVKCGEIFVIYDDGIGVCCGDGEIIITEIKISGKKQMKVADYLNGTSKNKLLGQVFNEVDG